MASLSERLRELADLYDRLEGGPMWQIFEELDEIGRAIARGRPDPVFPCSKCAAPLSVERTLLEGKPWGIIWEGKGCPACGADN